MPRRQTLCSPDLWLLRLARRGLALLGLAALASAPFASAQQQAILPSVSIVLTLSVPDSGSWLGMQQEILSTPDGSQKSVLATIRSRTGDSRIVIILTPKFTATMGSTAGAAVRVVVKGKVSGDYAQQMLVPFMAAFSESGLGPDQNAVTIEYGLTTLKASLLELKLEDR